MRHDSDDRWEPEEETGWCPHCKKECTIIGLDVGIGPYECHGRKGRHVDIVAASDCCELDFLEYEPEEEDGI